MKKLLLLIPRAIVGIIYWLAGGRGKRDDDDRPYMGPLG